MNVTMLAAVKKEIENFKEFYDGRGKSGKYEEGLR